MGRRAKAVSSGATLGTVAATCSACGKHLPRSAFSKAELSRSGAGRCRGCAQRVQCIGCNLWILPAALDDRSRCRRCVENEQVDRLLQTPKDEVTHFGAWRALRLQRESEYALLLACHRFGIWERMILQTILGFVRVPFITSHGGMHYCELCDEAFEELDVKKGSQVRMAEARSSVDCNGCPGKLLDFKAGDVFQIAEVRKVSNGKWFFRSHIAPKALGSRSLKMACDTPDATLDTSNTTNNLATASRSLALTLVGSPSDVQAADHLWAPLHASFEGRRVPPLSEHLASQIHTSFEESVNLGRTLLVSRAAIELAGKLGERPTTSLSRFRSGLGITSRFCEPKDLECARCLEKVRDSTIPVKFLRESFPNRTDFQWLTADDLAAAEVKYQHRRGMRKPP